MAEESEYDFAFEFQQYAESLQKPLKTFRVDFSANNVPTGEGYVARDGDLFTTTYSTTQFSTTKTTKSVYDATDYVHTTTATNGTAGPVPTANTSKQSQIQFNEIHSLKRVQTKNENVGTTEFVGGGTNVKHLLDITGIRDPRTGRVLTIGDAIQMRILDVRTGEMLIGDKRISLEEAVKQGLIDAKLAHQLLQPGAARDGRDGRELSLLEVIQREITEAESGYETAEKRIKVTVEDSPDAENPKNIADAISAGNVDTKTGLYRVKSGKTITLAEAYERGYLIRHESVTIKSNALCLSDAIAHGLVDTAGWIADRNSGDKFRLDSAIANQLIDPNIREVVDAKKDTKITLTEALNSGILNPKTGRYWNEVTKEKLTFIEAKNRQLIVKPYTLKDICDLNLLDKQSKITSPMRREKLSIMQAMESGVLDGNNLKCVTKRKGELVTLQEAIADGIVLPAESKYRDYMTSEVLSIPEAVERGLISSVSQKSIFDIDGFKDMRSNDFVSFNVALSRGILRRKSNGFALETSRDTHVPLEVALNEGLIRPEVYEMFNRGIGVHNASGNELSVFDLCYHNLIDPKTGYLLDPKAEETVPLDLAIERKFITPEGALLLSSLLNITLTTETVTRTINRYVTIRAGSQEPLESSVVLTFTEALRQGFIDEERQLFKDPKTGKIYSVQQALSHGLLQPDANDTVPEPTNRKKTKSTITIVTKQIVPESEPIKLNTQNFIEKSVEIPITEEVIKSGKINTDFIQSEKTSYVEQNVHERQIIEFPPGGWPLKDAIEQQLFNPDSGVFHIKGTERAVTFEECINKYIINSLSLSVIDPRTGEKLSIRNAFERDIIDSYGNYTNKNDEIETMRSAINNGKIILEHVPSTKTSAREQCILRISKINNLPEIVEISTPLLSGSTQKFVEVRTVQRELTSPEPLQIAPGAIYDPSTALVIFTHNGQTENIFDAARHGLIDENLIRILDPQTNEVISISEALERKIYDPQNGTILTSEGYSVDILTAIQKGLIIVTGAPLVAAEGALRTIRFVTDPRTGEQIPVEVAYERGIVSRDQLRKTKSFESDSGEEKVVVLQKMRKMILKPGDAFKKGIIDATACNILENKDNFLDENNEVLNISEALERGQIDGSKGKIADPQRNRFLNINEAVKERIIDPEETNHILIPLAQSLSIPKLMEQGLIDTKTQTIVHPESGYGLNIREAIVCDVLDQYSKLKRPIKCTLEEAIEKHIVDPEESTFNVNGKILTLAQAISADVFDKSNDNVKPLVPIAPVGMTFPVVVEKGLLKPETVSVIHPETRKEIPLKKAIEEGFIMSVPYPPQSDAIEVHHAVQHGLINIVDQTFKHPNDNGQATAIRPALETGRLVVKPISDFVVTQKPIARTEVMETITAVHTVTTKTIELVQGYVLISNNEVQNVQTGEVCTLDEAKALGILREEETSKESRSVSGNKDNIDELLEQNNDDRQTPSSNDTVPTTMDNRNKSQVIQHVTTTIEGSHRTAQDSPTDSKLSSTLNNVKEAAKIGAIGIVAAPVLAGGAIVSGIKQLVKTTTTTTKSSEEAQHDVLPIKETSTTVVSIESGDKLPKSKDLLPSHGSNIDDPKLSTTVTTTVTKDEVNISQIPENSYKKNDDALQPKDAVSHLPTNDPQNIDNLVKETENFITTTTANFINQEQNVEYYAPEGMQISDTPKNEQNKGTTTATPSKMEPNIKTETHASVSNLPESDDQGHKQIASKDGSRDDASTVVITTETSVASTDPINEIVEISDGKVQPTSVNKAGEVESTTMDTTTTTTTTTTVTTTKITKELTAADTMTMEAIDVADNKHPEKYSNVTDFIRHETNVLSRPEESEMPSSGSKSEIANITKRDNVSEIPSQLTEHTINTLEITRKDTDVIGSGSVFEAPLQPFEEAKPDLMSIDEETTLIGETINDKVQTKQDEGQYILEPIERVDSSIQRPLSDVRSEATASEDDKTPYSQEKIYEEISPKSSPLTTTPEKSLNEKDAQESKTTDESSKSTEDPNFTLSTQTKDKPTTATRSTTDKPSDLTQTKSHPKDSHQSVVDFIQAEKGDHQTPSETSSNVLQNVKDAAKFGALALVGAPVLAGKAIVDALKSDGKPSDVISSTTYNTTVTTISSTTTKPIESATIPEYTSESGNQQRSSPPKTLALGDAISQKLISPDECKIVVDGEEQDQSVSELLKDEQLSPLDEVQVLDDKLVVLQPLTYMIDATDDLTPEHLSELNIYDPVNQYFIDPSSGMKISFQTLVFDMNIFNPETILVKNFSTGQYETLTDALERPLLDRHNGHMVDPKTGKKIPFFECVNRNWIIRANPEKEKPAAIENVIDPATGKVILGDGRICSIVDAINNGLLDIQSISVRDPVSGEVIPLRMAIELGVVDMQAGTVIDIQTLKEIPMEDAFKLGFLVPGARKPISLEAAVRKGLYDPDTGKLYDSESDNQVDVQKSIEIGLVDPKISLIVDSKSQKAIKLDCAIEDELVVTETGKIKDTKTNTLVPFDIGVEKKLVKTDSITWSLPEVLQREYYSPKTGKILNPTTGEEILLQQAIEMGFVEIDTCLVKDDDKHAIVSGKQAAKVGLLDTVRGCLNSPNIKLDEAFVKGYLISTKKPLSLVDCLLRGLYDPDTSKFTIDDKNVDLKTAITLKLINADELVLLDPKTESIISLTEAISKGYIDPVNGYVINPYTGTKLSLNEALENRVLIPPKRKRSLPDAVYRGLYDPKTGEFSNTITREKLSTERAIRRGILDPDSTIVSVAGEVIPFEKAAQVGIVDSHRGTVKDDEDKEIDFKEAFDRGVLLEAKKPLRLIEAVIKNVYDESDGSFMDPKTGLKLSFAQAVDSNLLDEESVQIRDFNTGLYKQLNLAHATESGVIDGKNAKLVYNNQKITIKHAFDVGILMDTQAPLSLQRALHQGLLDEKTGKLTDAKTGRKITLLESIRSFVINPQLPCYFDEINEQMHNLNDTCRMGIINRREGVFREPGSNTFVSLNEALSLGLIVDIENASFGLYELLAMGFYDVNTRKVIHPVTGRKLNLNEACVEDVVSLSSSLIKNHKTGKYIRLAQAIKEQVIDDTNGCYNLSPTERIDLQEARARGLIVSNRRLMCLEMVMRMHLFRPETGRFCDPTTGEFYDLAESIQNGFIDPATTIFKNHITGKELPLNEAIANGDIDVTKGRVFDPKTKSAYNYEVALGRGILVTTMKPLTERSEVINRQDSVELLSQTPMSVVISKPREMSLEEAIKYNIIDPKTALVRDFDSFKFVPFEVAQQNGMIDMSKRTIVDPKALYFVFDPTLVIYVREPITFEHAAEIKSLDLETGMLTYHEPAASQPDQTTENDDTKAKPLEPLVYTLKDATTLGIIDPDSAFVKDLAKSKLVRLPEAFRKGLMDANKANVLNTKTSKLFSLNEAYENGLIVTPKRSFGLLEGISFNLYNPTNGCFVDPFQMNPDIIKRKKFTLAEAITAGLIDPTSTVVRNPSTGEILPLTAAIQTGLIDAHEGRIYDEVDSKNNMDLVKAAEKGLLLAAEQRQAVFEKFNMCEENVNELLKWVYSVEHKIATVGGPREKIDELRNQINALKQIKDEIEAQQRPVATCLEQVRQIVLTGGDVLSAPEVTTLENAGRELRSRVDRVNDRTVRLLRRLEAGRDELTKLRGELDIFSDWLQSARRTLEDKERALSDITRLSSQGESVREFVSDVIGHQADLRFITMAAQKFVDESKEFLAILNEFRTSLPERLPHVEPLASSESPIRQEVSLVSAQYKDLMNRVNALQDRISGLGGRQREYQEALDKANEWLRSAQPRVSRVIAEPIAGDPKSVQEQMNEAKALHNELLSNGRLVDNAQQALDSLLYSLGGQLSPMEINQLEIPVADLKDKYQKILDSLGEHCKTLDKTLVQSQGVQEALDNLGNWVNQAEDKFKLQLRPASLIKERLQEQIREHKSLLADMQSHQASIDSVQSSAKHLMSTASNARIAKKVETNLNDVTTKFDKLYDKVVKRGEFLDDVYNRLVKYMDEISGIEQEVVSLQDALDNRDTNLLSSEDLARRMQELSNHKESLTPSYEDCIRNGKDLISIRDVTDTSALRDRIKALESQWRNVNVSLDEKAKLSKQKAEHQVAYESLKDQVLSWLASTETRISGLAPVAIDLDKIRQQNDELKPIYKDYRDYASTIDKINDIGAQYDALIRPESPGRKRSTFSPIKRVSPLRRMSGDARSPSPTKGGILSPLSTGSSGFGSRRSSQDGFQLSEMSPVQQQLSEINNRYSLIGVRINDRQNELDNMSEEVRKQFENLKNLATFLERIQRQLPKESVSNKDDSDRCIKQARKILEDMYEKQSLLDTTKTQIKDILRRKSDVPGAEQLRVENDNIVEKWKQLSDICKSRINFSEKLRDFLDTHNNLKNWLDSKDRMLTVLGPISSDPRMVQSQVQQVQVLREEFRTQQPQLKHFQEIGHDVLDHLEANTPDANAVDKKLQDINKKWEDLVGRLDERANSLGGAADSSKEFDAAVNRLREALQQISDNLDSLPSDGDHQENLRKIENLERQLEGQRPLLADAEQSAAALCNILGDPASRSDVNSRVAALEKQYQALQKKLDTKKAETEATLRDGRHFAENCSKTLGWLSAELSNLAERLLVSAHKPTLQHQIDTHEPIYREVMAREHEIIMLINKGKDLSDRQQDRTVKRDLERIQQQWEKLRREAVDRHTRLQTCMEHCKKYATTSEVFLAWLRTAEDKLTDLTPGVLSKSKLDTRLRDLQTFRSEVWKHSGEYENTKGLGETFLTSCDVDKEPIKGELQDIRERWERLNNDLIARAHEIENCSRRLGDFNDELRNLDHAVGRCEDRLAAHDALGGAAKDPKLLDRVKAIREELTNLQKPLQTLKGMAKDICAEARAAGGDADHLTDDVDGISDRIGELQSRLDDRLGELQSAATAVTQFNEQIKNLSIDLNSIESEVEKLSPPAREIKRVQGQIDDTFKLQTKLERIVERIEDGERAADALVDAGFSPDTAQTREQISTLRKTLARLDNRVRDHSQNLEDTLRLLQQFYDMESQTMDDIQDISEEFRRMKPVGSELEQIRRQQEDFRSFRENKIEPLAQNIEKVNVAGRDLVRSAASGVSTTQIEKDLEKLNDRWNDLKERMNERDRRLDVALLQSGKFQEALAGLSKWLSDTEEMVANQKAPSSDYKVVKAQLQEQKFLKRMLLDRQHSMSSLSSLGKEVAAHCEPSERTAIEKQLHDLMKRFDALTDGAEQREQDLEEAMEVAKRFHDKITPLELWLDNTERAVKGMELIPTDEEKIQQRIRDHGRLHDEILGKKPDFSDLADVAGQLMHLVSDEEAVNLGEKVRTITDRYTGLVDASDNIGALLADSRQGLRHLVLTYQELVAWMERMENELKRFRSVPVYAEKLLEQMDILIELNENIANNAPNVESTVESGAELMKHISNDEAIQLKDKLDSLQRRYGELTNRGGDLLKSAENALPLVKQFHEAHNRLIEWMQVAEAALNTSEPRQSDVLRLETELAEMRPTLDCVNLVGPKLCQLSPGEGASTIETIVTRDNRRFDAIVEQIQRKAERLHLSNQRAKEVTSDIDELLEWFREMDANLREADPPAIEPKLVRAQLQEHRSINDDISSQKGRVRDVTAASKKVLRESPQSENTTTLREKLDDLKEIVDTVAQLCSERLGVLEQALPLSEHFADSHAGLTTWLDDMEQQISRLSMPALRPDQITQQQDKNERLLQSIVEHKPLLDKLNKTGEALGALVAEDDSARINEILDSDNARYAALRLELRERQQALDNALQESSQFSDKLEGMLRALANTVDQVNQLDPLSALPQKIREQIDDNDAIMEDLDKRSDAFSAVQRAASDVIAKAGNKQDPAVRDIKSKLEKLNNLWNDVQKATKKRGSSLDDILNVAEPFWNQLQSVMKTLKDLEETLSSQEPPAAQPQEIQKQQVALQEIRHEIDQTKPEVEQVRRHGSNLMHLCGEPDKPEVKKHIEDLDHAWDNITALYAKREENLIDAMEKAMEFHETLQNLLKFLSKAEEKFSHLGPVGSDIDAVKKQIEQLKAFKDEVDPHMVEVEALNRQAVELTERTSPEQAASIREPLAGVNRRWESLLRGMVERQKQLEHALLHLGQFQHALNELLVWINKTDGTLDQLKPIPGDPQLLEVELAKLKVLANDIQAHQNSVDTLNDAGRQLIESEKGSVEASTTQEKLRKLNQEWKMLLQKASDRQHELEESLREANGYIAEVQDILGWLGDVDAIIGASKPVGGLPETATEQLERFMEVYNELEENRAKVETIQAQGQEYIKRQNQMKVSSTNLTHTLRTLKQRWDAVVSRASDKKIKLEIALKEATEFHDTLQAFVEWLNQAEKQLANCQPVSRVLETIQVQMEEHKILQKDVSTHREAMLLLDKKGTHLKYFSQKQDVILIKNLLVSVQHRWERIVSKAAERTRALDHGYKEAREFNDAWNNMMQYLQETETVLDQIIEEATSSKDPQKIKKCIARLKDTHRQLTGKQSLYDSTMRNGKNLMERAPKSDEAVLGKMLCELKDQWTRVLSKSIERQRKLEEALLLSGQFSDALGELLEWLKKAKQRLNEDGPVHGDVETVNGLCEHHKHIEQDLQKRAAQMQGVLKTGRDLERSGNNPDVGRQLDELQTVWDEVQKATAKRGERLQFALKDAQKLNGSIQALFDWLDHAEHKLRYAKNAPDDEKISREMMDMHMEFMRDLRTRETQKHETFEFAEEIIGKAYPDAIPIIKNWLSIIEERWEEVKQWAINREAKLEQHLQSLKDLDETIEELLAWLSGLEATLLNLERESLPDEIPPLEKLIEDHKEFMENTARRQTEVDRACKPKQLPPGARKMSRTAKTPVRGSSHDIREQSPDGTLRRQSFKGSRDQGLNNRKSSSRMTPNRDTPDRDRLPHYGPRFSPSSVGPELEFRSTRAKLLWDKWRHVWMLSWERQRRLNDHLMYLKDLERVRNFSWDDWRKRFLKHMNHKKSRLTDLFRKMDKDNNGLVPRGEFIDGILNTKFDTSRMEMGAVADLFDRNGEGLIDWQEFIAALRPDWQERKPQTDSDKIHDEVKRLVMLCTCRQKFRVFQVGEGKYRFGDSQKLRLVRILRSTVMVRVGGGWVALDEFLTKNDPCRADEHLAELMPIFERIRAQEQVPCAFPIHMGAGGTVFVRCNSSRSVPLSPHVMHCHPTTHWVRERSVRSIPMKQTRSSQSVSTPDSLSDNEGSHGHAYTPRKVTYTSTRNALTPGGSRGGSKPNSRPLSRQGSKPPSHHGSTMSLDSTGEHTPSRIPQRKQSGASTVSGTGTTPRPARLSVTSTTSRTNGTSTMTRKTASGSASPVPTSYRPSRIPVKVSNSFDKSLSANSSPTNSTSNSLNPNSSLGRNVSGTSTPSGMQTPRKSSAEPTFSSTMRSRTSRGTTPVEKREPFRL
ncbi:dystonin-like protein short stop isoform X14 [Haematobia irritans]|uniref:dystonin-like protein short stop isoform X14 n=1 Tax=Haematobia irritans TaxID=7368 RepID=UPI003F4F58A9